MQKIGHPQATAQGCSGGMYSVTREMETGHRKPQVQSGRDEVTGGEPHAFQELTLIYLGFSRQGFSM